MAGASSRRWLWLVLAVIAADRASKFAVERFTEEGYQRELVPGVAFLVHSVNSGIAFGLFSESTPKWLSVLLIGVALAVILLLAWILLSGKAGGALPHAGLALILAGAAGNLLDRILHGGVTDFLELRAGSFRWPAFNVADSAITVGAFFLIFSLLVSDRRAAGERA